MKLTVTAIPNEESDFGNDSVLLMTTTPTSKGLTPLHELNKSPSSFGSSAAALRLDARTYHFDSLPGHLRENAPEPTDLQLVLISDSSNGATFSFDDLQLLEENVNLELKELDPLPLTAVIESFPDPSTGILTKPYLNFPVRYQEPSIDRTSLGNDDLLFRNSTQEGNDVRLEFLRHEDQENGEIVAHYRILEPKDGWESIANPRYLYMRAGGIRAENGAPFEDLHIDWLNIPPFHKAQYFGTSQLTQSDAFIDLPIRFTSWKEIDVESLGDDDVFVSLKDEQKLFAALIEIEIEEIRDHGRDVTAIFRLERPSYG
jgi:hypothetical protein